jgi:hypothetical protein
MSSIKKFTVWDWAIMALIIVAGLVFIEDADRSGKGWIELFNTFMNSCKEIFRGVFYNIFKSPSSANSNGSDNLPYLAWFGLGSLFSSH